jgi:cytochrome c
MMPLPDVWRRALVAAGLGCASVAAVGADDAAGRALASRHGCFACHGMVHKQVGPGFAQVAERYRGDAAMPAQLAAKIRSGGVGNWGRVIMPRQVRVSEADAQLLARWVLAQPAP